MKIAGRLAAAAVLATSALAAPAFAANNPPPNGTVVFNLDGQPLPHEYTHYTTNFTAGDALTNLAFAFREDPAYFSIDNISLALAGGGPNLVVNGDFEQGPLGSHEPTGWSYLNLYNADAAGVVSTGCGTGGSNCYYDGAVGSYDTITQAIGTAVGSLYTLSFDLTDSSGQTTGSALQNGDASGINLVVYAGAANPTLTSAVPEPATWGMMIGGIGLIGLAMRRRQRVSTRVAFA